MGNCHCTVCDRRIQKKNIFPSGMYGVNQCRLTRSCAKSCLASVLTGIQEFFVFFPFEFLWNSARVEQIYTGQQPKQRNSEKKWTIERSLHYLLNHWTRYCLNYLQLPSWHIRNIKEKSTAQTPIGMGCAIYSSVSAGSKCLGRASRVSIWTSGNMARRVLPGAALLALWRRPMDLDGSTLGCPKELSKLPAGSAPGVSLSKLTEWSSQKQFLGASTRRLFV